MYIHNRFVLCAGLVLAAIGLGFGFLPVPQDPSSGLDLAFRIGFILLFLPIALTWAYGLNCVTRRTGALDIVLPLLAVFNLRDVIGVSTPLTTAVPLNGIMLIVCGIGLVLLYGVGYGKRKVRSESDSFGSGGATQV